MEPRTPIMLITGSLGSGKTTLLRRILDGADRRLAVLMNEFGEIAIDSKIIEGENVRIIELAGGCVCCSMTGELEAAVQEIIEKIGPDYIVLEATGVAESDALVYEVEDNLPQVRLDSVICIVDAYVSVKHPYVGYTARAQLQAADIVLVNKIDLVATDEMKEVESQVREHNDTAMIFRTVGCDVDPRILFGPNVERRPVSLPPHHAEAELQSFTYSAEAAMDEDKFRRLISDLPYEVFRAKGFVRFFETTYLFNYVVGRHDLEEFEPRSTQLVFIGPHLDQVKDHILEALKKCEVSNAL